MMTAVDELVRVTGRTKQSFVTELVESALTATRGDVADDAVCDLEEVASMLRVTTDQVLDRIGEGLPGRRFGEEWRFSRFAVMEWLAGSDGTANYSLGYAP